MSVWSLAIAYLRDRALNAALNVILLAIGAGTVAALLLFSHQSETRLARDAAGIDLVVGAKGSPLQLILSSVFHADIPTGNIPRAEIERLEAERLVDTVIPLAMGDSFRGYRIVGAPHAYAEHYGAEVADGDLWRAPLEATLGASVAAQTDLRIGDRFVSSHGFGGGGGGHAHAPFDVVGVLKPTGTVLDRLILTPVESVWIAHGVSPDDEPGENPNGDPDVTAILVKYASPLAAASLPRRINDDTVAMAAVPATELARLLSLMGGGIDVIRGFAWVLIAASGLGVFVTLVTAMRERRRDIALMRSMGATRGRVFAQVLIEGLIVSALGAVLGLALGHLAVEMFAQFSPRARDLGVTGFALAPGEWVIPVIALAVGAIGSVLPAALAYRLDIVRALS